MTAVGKVLVFLNFVFSIAVVYFLAQTFVTRDNWRKKYEEQKNLNLIIEAKYKERDVRADTEVKAVHPENAEMARRLEDVEKRLKFYEGDKTVNPAVPGKYEQATDQIAELEKQKKAIQTNLTATESEIAVLRDERVILVKQAETERANVLAIQKKLNDEMRKTVEVTIDRDQFKQKSERMLTRVEELEKQVTTLTNTINSLGPIAGKSARSLLTPPPVPAPPDVYGTVKAVATSGITVISLGSDSGISAGNKLEVYRIDEKNPRNSVYMGELIVSRTEPKQAVGQFYPKPFAKPEERLPRADDPAKGVKGDVVTTGLNNK